MDFLNHDDASRGAGWIMQRDAPWSDLVDLLMGRRIAMQHGDWLCV
jgi:hypothetical protein